MVKYAAVNEYIRSDLKAVVHLILDGVAAPQLHHPR